MWEKCGDGAGKWFKSDPLCAFACAFGFCGGLRGVGAKHLLELSRSELLIWRKGGLGNGCVASICGNFRVAVFAGRKAPTMPRVANDAMRYIAANAMCH